MYRITAPYVRCSGAPYPSRGAGRIWSPAEATDNSLEHDEFIRNDTTAEVLAALPAQPRTTRMTAANSTPLTHGASAVVLASGERAAELGINR